MTEKQSSKKGWDSGFWQNEISNLSDDHALKASSWGISAPLQAWPEERHTSNADPPTGSKQTASTSWDLDIDWEGKAKSSISTRPAATYPPETSSQPTNGVPTSWSTQESAPFSSNQTPPVLTTSLSAMLSSKDELPLYTQVTPSYAVPSQSNPPCASAKDAGQEVGLVSDAMEDEEGDDDEEDEDEDEDEEEDDGEPITISLATLMKMNSSTPKEREPKRNEPLMFECSLEDLLLGTESERIRKILDQLQGAPDGITLSKPKLNAHAPVFNTPSPSPSLSLAKASQLKSDSPVSTHSRKNSLASTASSNTPFNIKAPAFVMPKTASDASHSRKSSTASSTASSSRWNVKAAPFTIPNEFSPHNTSGSPSRRNSNASSAASSTRWNINAAAFTMPTDTPAEGAMVKDMARENSNASPTTSTATSNVKAPLFTASPESSPGSSLSRKGSNASSTASAGLNIKASPFFMPSADTPPSKPSRRESVASSTPSPSLNIDAASFVMPNESSLGEPQRSDESQQSSDSSSTTSTDLNIIVAPFTIPAEPSSFLKGPLAEEAENDERTGFKDQDTPRTKEAERSGLDQNDACAVKLSESSCQNKAKAESAEKHAAAKSSDREAQEEEKTEAAGDMSAHESRDAVHTVQEDAVVSEKPITEEISKANMTEDLSEGASTNIEETKEEKKQFIAASDTTDGMADRKSEAQSATTLGLPGKAYKGQTAEKATDRMPYPPQETLDSIEDTAEDDAAGAPHETLTSKDTAEDVMERNGSSRQPSSIPTTTPLHVYEDDHPRILNPTTRAELDITG